MGRHAPGTPVAMSWNKCNGITLGFLSDSHGNIWCVTRLFFDET
jgi:hypothetical protein